MFGARRKRKGSGADDATAPDDSKKAEVLHSHFASTFSPEEQAFNVKGGPGMHEEQSKH